MCFVLGFEVLVFLVCLVSILPRDLSRHVCLGVGMSEKGVWRQKK